MFFCFNPAKLLDTLYSTIKTYKSRTNSAWVGTTAGKRFFWCQKISKPFSRHPIGLTLEQLLDKFDLSPAALM